MGELGGNSRTNAQSSEPTPNSSGNAIPALANGTSSMNRMMDQGSNFVDSMKAALAGLIELLLGAMKKNKEAL